MLILCGYSCNLQSSPIFFMDLFMKLPMLLQNVNGKKFAHSLTHSLTHSQLQQLFLNIFLICLGLLEILLNNYEEKNQ